MMVGNFLLAKCFATEILSEQINAKQLTFAGECIQFVLWLHIKHVTFQIANCGNVPLIRM